MTQSTLLTKLLAFLAIDVVIVIASWYIPSDASAIRTMASSVQLFFLAVTAYVNTQFVVEDF